MRNTLRILMLAAILAAPAAAASPLPLPAAPYASRPNYAHAVQPFHWGWFGAERYAPVVHHHKGYYGHPYSWSHRRW